MKKINVALINNILYCKFPDGIKNITEFIEFLNKNYHSFVELDFFVEKDCAAPFFIEEDLKTEKEYFNPSNVLSVKESEVYLLCRYEYEEKLKKVIQEKCIFCKYYSEGECEQAFHSLVEHINLNGECYGFEKE